MNEYDSNRISDIASTIGFKKTNVSKDADCFVLNTCHIRQKATEKVYDEIGRVKKNFRNLKKPLVIVAGCVAQAESDEMIKREPYIDMVIGPQSYHKIADLILDYKRNNKKIDATEFDVVKKFDELNKIPNTQNKISSYITIQEGCDKFCHFCVVPYTRGPEYSRSFTQIIEEANTLVNNGAKEIILLGQNVNAYNYKKYRLSSLIKELDSIKNLKRIRFTTSHPKDMTKDLIESYRNCKKLMPLLHLPIQSGSNSILKSMNRKHDREYYLSVIKKLKNINKNIKISSDFIVGYPNETKKDFADTIDIIKKIGFINSYSFIFSPRPGTPAYDLTNQSEINTFSENKKKLKKLQNILDNFQLEYNKSFLNKYTEVLIENKLKKQEKYFGRTENMIPVIFDSNNCQSGELVSVKITSFNQRNLFGFHIDNKVKAA